jgi:16S rRNA (cytidine1402-2'-O)-methyltransferase
MPASLFVVSTPIGNLEDITLRALSTLKAVSLIAAEDTRRTLVLLRHFGITTPTTSLHEHNEKQKLPHLLGRLAAGEDIALVSDAGTPLVADPGQRLIAAAIEAGASVIPIPGPSAVSAALSVSGLAADSFVFAGFAPSRLNDRTRWLQNLANEARTIVLFEAPHRIRRTLGELYAILGERQIIICRELTKMHEQVVRTGTSLAPSLDIAERGEFTLVLSGKSSSSMEPQVTDDKLIGEFFYRLTNTVGVSRRDALIQTAHKFGLSTNAVYKTIEKLKASSTA